MYVDVFNHEGSRFLGKDHSDILHSTRNTDEKPIVKNLFEVSQRLIREQRLEFSGVSEISWGTSPWRRLSVVNDEEVINLSKANVCVFSHSVLCLGRVRPFPESIEEWKTKLKWFKDSKQYRTLDTIYGEPMEFERMIFPGFTTFQILFEIQTLMTDLDCESEQIQGRILFMSTCNDIVWEIRKTKEYVLPTPHLWLNIQRSSLRVIGPWTRVRNEMERDRHFQAWSTMYRVARLMMIDFSESRHPIFRATSALERGTLISKRGGKLSIHFCGDCDPVDVIFRTVVSVNQLSIHGAIADLCEELSPPLTSTEKLYYAAMDKLESFVLSADILNIQRPLLTNELAQGNFCGVVLDSFL